MSPANMLELQKLVLENVCENKLLFSKELEKSFKWLNHEDLVNLYQWSTLRFKGSYQQLIDCVYASFDFWSQPSNIVYLLESQS